MMRNNSKSPLYFSMQDGKAFEQNSIHCGLLASMLLSGSHLLPVWDLLRPILLVDYSTSVPPSRRTGQSVEPLQDYGFSHSQNIASRNQ